MEHSFYRQYIFPMSLWFCEEIVENFCVVYIIEIAC